MQTAAGEPRRRRYLGRVSSAVGVTPGIREKSGRGDFEELELGKEELETRGWGVSSIERILELDEMIE